MYQPAERALLRVLHEAVVEGQQGEAREGRGCREEELGRECDLQVRSVLFKRDVVDVAVPAEALVGEEHGGGEAYGEDLRGLEWGRFHG